MNLRYCTVHQCKTRVVLKCKLDGSSSKHGKPSTISTARKSRTMLKVRLNSCRASSKVTSQVVEDVARCPLASRAGVLTLYLCVLSKKRRTKSYDKKSSVVVQSSNPKMSCPPSRVSTFRSVRINGLLRRRQSMAEASEGNCRSVAMGLACSSCGTSSDEGSTEDVVWPKS
jgi:hypothetical protein